MKTLKVFREWSYVKKYLLMINVSFLDIHQGVSVTKWKSEMNVLKRLAYSSSIREICLKCVWGN